MENEIKNFSQEEKARLLNLANYFLRINFSLLELFDTLKKEELEIIIAENEQIGITRPLKLEELIANLGCLAAEISINVSRYITENNLKEENDFYRSFKSPNIFFDNSSNN